ncbi:MAG: GNAT family N-acetyltransferase [Clostridia bacterium]|nr:GNAT family N-acetyltransferase [Clostridia bacterium]
MITLSNSLEGFYAKKVSLAQILCLKSAFDGSKLESEVWLQKENGEVHSAIARHGGRLYIASDSHYPEELKNFISVVCCAEIFTEKSTAEILDLDIKQEFNVLHMLKDEEPLPFSSNNGLSELYSALSSGIDGDVFLPSFDIFAPDVSHRIRHGAAVALAEEFGGALAFKSQNAAVINGIAVKKDSRQRGFGSLLLNRLIAHLHGDVFACTSDENNNFYIKNGFVLIDSAVITNP